MKAVKVRALAPKERRLPWDEEWSGQEMLDPIADGEVWRSGRLSLEERLDVEDEEQSPTVWEGDQSFLATCDEVRDPGATSESGSMASSPCRSSMVASWTLSESDEGGLEEWDQGVTPMQTSSVRLRRNSMRSWPTTPTTSGGMGLGGLILCTQVVQTEAQDGRREGEGGYELVIFVVVVSFIAIMCYRVVESTVRAILEQRNRLPEPAGPEVREVQTEAVETEEDMKRRLREEVNRTFRLERVRRLQEEREEEERLERRLEQQQRELSVRESSGAEEEVMTFERRSPSTATESASSSADGLRRRGQHPLQRELRQLREEVERGCEPEPEARRGAMVELYHVTSFGERYHWTRDCWGLRGAVARGIRAMLPCPNCWLGAHQQRGRNGTAWRGSDGYLHSANNCIPMDEHSTTIRGLPLRPCRFCMNGITSDPSMR